MRQSTETQEPPRLETVIAILCTANVFVLLALVTFLVYFVFVAIDHPRFGWEVLRGLGPANLAAGAALLIPGIVLVRVARVKLGVVHRLLLLVPPGAMLALGVVAYLLDRDTALRVQRFFS